eukprot:6193709-Pleurochrysis_carterae.AAC.1
MQNYSRFNPPCCIGFPSSLNRLQFPSTSLLLATQLSTDVAESATHEIEEAAAAIGCRLPRPLVEYVVQKPVRLSSKNSNSSSASARPKRRRHAGHSFFA